MNADAAAPAGRPGKPAGPRLRILHEDPHLVAVLKPAGLPSVPSEGDTGRTCASELALSHPTARPVHRLDRDVSGVMLFALDEPTRQALEILFRERALEKTYLAIVNDVPREPGGTIRKPIADLGKRARLGGHGAAQAVTHWRLRERFRGAALLEVRIETGRYNQIRIHLSAVGHPLVGERKYARGRDSLIRFRRPALHAWKLAFDHPATGKRLVLEAPVPEDLRRLMTDLRGG